MNQTLRNKLVGAIAGGASAITIAAVMLGVWKGDAFKHIRMLLVSGLYVTDKLVQTFAAATATVIKNVTLCCSPICARWLAIDPLIKVRIPEPTRAALYSFTYNVGSGAFASSTLLKKLNSGDVPGACKELQRWTYAGGKQMKGLITRREIEREVC